MKTKCEKCKHLKKNEFGFICTKLKHPLENGFAMKWHSDRCGEW